MRAPSRAADVIRLVVAGANAVRSQVMEAREEPRGPGYDDWFDEPELPTETQSGVNRGVQEDPEEVWVLPEDEEGRSSGQREFVIAGRTLTMTQVAIIALSILAIIFA